MEKNIRKSLNLFLDKYHKIKSELNDAAIISNIDKYTKLAKDFKNITPIVKKYQTFLDFEESIKDSEDILKNEKDKEMIEFAKSEIHDAKAALPVIEQELRILLLPKDEADDKNVIIEIRGAAGGDEANIFAADLFKMYSRYAEFAKWKIKVLETQYSEKNGISFIAFSITGNKVYSKMKFETGSHRVQRVPETESSGRVHTSTAVVTVFPEADATVKIEIKSSDLRIDTFRASGAGGQHVNTTDSAIRITHLPSGIVVSSQDGRNQHSNKQQAMNVLRSKLYDKQIEEKNKKDGIVRKLAGSGARSEKIRTYNYPQNRVTDHRIHFSSNNLDKIMEGQLQPFFVALITREQAEKIKTANI